MVLYKEHFDDLKKKIDSKNEFNAINGEFFAAKQLLKLHFDATQRKNPIIVELGVEKGSSTKTFLNAIANKSHSFLISVDIEDCSTAGSSDKWKFIQSDSTDIDTILNQAPIIKERGIDLLYIDSSHSAQHVQKEFELFYPLLNKNASIFFDDCDNFPYMLNQRKNNPGIEYGLKKIKNLIENIVRSNLSDLELTMYYGSSGLAMIKKTSNRGYQLKKIIHFKERSFLSAILSLRFSYLLKKVGRIIIGIFK